MKRTKSDDKTTIKNDSFSEEAQMNARLVSEWYDRLSSDVDKCVFCDLRDKYLIYEKDGIVLTVNLFPYIEGHLMVIPRRHIEKMSLMTPEEWLATKDLIDLGMELLVNELGYENINVLYREGSRSSGSSVKHLHIHILPVTPEFMQYEKTHFKWVFQKIQHPPRVTAEKLRKALESRNKKGKNELNT